MVFDFKSCVSQIQERTTLKSWILGESVNSTRYSLEANFRTKIDEILEGFGKICLGYVGAAMKSDGYHIKQMFDEAPIRIMISSRNWDEGEWATCVTFHKESRNFVISKGFYHRDRKTISIQSSEKCHGDSASDITHQLRNVMHDVKHRKDRREEPLSGINLKRGPK